MAAPEVPLRYAGVERGSAAFRLMKQMGWQEGEGLGKDKQGIREYVKVRNKQDSAGVGVDKEANKWAFDTSQFDNILKKLKVQAVQPDGEDINGLVEVDGHENVPKDRTLKTTRPQGRYKKREKGKLVNSYSAKDLEGIFGNKIEDTQGSCDDDGNSESFIETESHLSSKSGDEISVQWWGHKHGFISGGFLGSQSLKKSKICPAIAKRTAFAEEDQENLYKLVQDKSTTGKQGLGIKDRPKKTAGCNWKGKKTSFDDSDEENIEHGCSVKRKRNEESEIGENEKPKLKLKRLCKQLLYQVPGHTLKLKQLKVLVETQSASTFSKFSSNHDAVSYLKQKLDRSTKFCVEGKRVRLSSAS